jgi:scyllo-inositol 2-dehydrogenase (NADP+)
MNVGLVGFGFAGRAFHAPVISSVPGLKLTSILQRTGSDALERYPHARLVRSLPELLADQQMRLVVIATPNNSHFDLARDCLLAGRHVVIDKPFTTTAAEALKLIDLAKSRDCILTVYHNRRWDGDFLTVRKLLAAGALGRLVDFRSSFDRFRPRLKPGAWRERAEPGAGLLFDLGPHLIDQALVLFGLPRRIHADVRIERDGAVVDDAFDLDMYYPDLRVRLSATMLAAAPSARFTLHGTSGSFIKFGLDPQEEALRRGDVPGGADWGKDPEKCWGQLFTGSEGRICASSVAAERGDYRAFYEDLRDAIAANRPPAVTSEQAYNVMQILERAKKEQA